MKSVTGRFPPLVPTMLSSCISTLMKITVRKGWAEPFFFQVCSYPLQWWTEDDQPLGMPWVQLPSHTHRKKKVHLPLNLPLLCLVFSGNHAKASLKGEHKPHEQLCYLHQHTEPLHAVSYHCDVQHCLVFVHVYSELAGG